MKMAIELKKEGDEFFVILPLKDFKEITEVYVDFMDFKVKMREDIRHKLDMEKSRLELEYIKEATLIKWGLIK
jgi:hypothetical protein